MGTAKLREPTNRLAAIHANLSNIQHPDDTGSQVSALVLQISHLATQEIDCLISDLNGLRAKIENRCCRIQDDVVEFAELSRSAIQVTKIVADSVAQVQTRPGSNNSSGSDRAADLEVASIAATQ
jgi:hypothetical protein